MISSFKRITLLDLLDTGAYKLCEFMRLHYKHEICQCIIITDVTGTGNEIVVYGAYLPSHA